MMHLEDIVSSVGGCSAGVKGYHDYNARISCVQYAIIKLLCNLRCLKARLKLLCNRLSTAQQPEPLFKTA